MIEFILEGDNLVLELNNFAFAVDQLSLLVLQIISLLVNQLVQIIDPSQLLGDIVLQSSCLSSQVRAFLGLKIILMVQIIDFFRVLSVSLPESMQLILEMLFLSHELRIQILVLSQVTLQPRNLHVAVIECIFLSIELRIEVSILLLPVDQEILLVVNLLPESLNHIDVDFDSAPVVLFHPPLVVSYSVEILLQRQ